MIKVVKCVFKLQFFFMQLWSLPSNNRFVGSLVGHTNWVRSGTLSVDGRCAASGSEDKTVKIWDLARLEALATYYDHSAAVNCVRFHPDGNLIASCSADGTIKLWDIRTHTLLQHYSAHFAPVNCIDFHPSGDFLISASDDMTLKIWDLREGQQLYTVHGHTGSALSVAFSSTGENFVSAGCDEMALLWNTNFDRVVEQLTSVTNDYKAGVPSRSSDDLLVKGTGHNRPAISTSLSAPRSSRPSTAAPKTFGQKRNPSTKSTRTMLPSKSPASLKISKSILPKKLQSRSQSIIVPSTATFRAIPSDGSQSHEPTGGLQFASQTLGATVVHHADAPSEGILEQFVHNSVQVDSELSFGGLESLKTSPIKSKKAPSRENTPHKAVLPTNMVAADQFSTVFSQVVSQLDVITSTLTMMQERMVQQEEKLVKLNKTTA